MFSRMEALKTGAWSRRSAGSRRMGGSTLLCAALLPLLLLTAGGITGCGSCQSDEEITLMFQVAESLYKSGRYDSAVGRYEAILKKCPDHYEAWIGMGNASREYGTDLFNTAHELAIEGKHDRAREVFGNAVAKHQDAFMCFYGRARDMRPDDLEWRMGLGIFWYQRAASVVSFPYPLDDKESRQRDRDKAIELFRYIVKRVPNSYRAHHYLSLLLLAAGDYDEALKHLDKYRRAIQTAYDYISYTWPDDDVKRKEAKDKALADLQKDISDVRELVLLYKDDLIRMQKKLVAKEAGLTAQERLTEGKAIQQEAARLTRLSLAIEKMSGEIVINELTAEEKQLRVRCVAYLKEFNGGNLMRALTFLDPVPEQRKKVRKRVVDQVEAKIQYLYPQFREFTISGDTATVTFDCNVKTPSETKEKRLVIGWRQVAGHWMVSQIP